MVAIPCKKTRTPPLQDESRSLERASYFANQLFPNNASALMVRIDSNSAEAYPDVGVLRVHCSGGGVLWLLTGLGECDPQERIVKHQFKKQFLPITFAFVLFGMCVSYKLETLVFLLR